MSTRSERAAVWMAVVCAARAWGTIASGSQITATRESSEISSVSSSSFLARISGTGQACSPPLGDRIAPADHDDRDRRGRLHRGDAGFGTSGDDDVDTEAHELSRQRLHPVAATIGGPPLDRDVTPFQVAPLSQPAWKGAFDPGIPRHDEESYTGNLSLPLRAGSHRGGERGDGAGDERSPVHHPTTWSARGRPYPVPVSLMALTILDQSPMVRGLWSAATTAFS
jgi:hypothetical protein